MTDTLSAILLEKETLNFYLYQAAFTASDIPTGPQVLCFPLFPSLLGPKALTIS